MWSKTVVFVAFSCLIWATVAQSYPQSQGKDQKQGPCGPPPSGPPPSGPPPSGMPPPRGGQGGPCGPPPTGNPPSSAAAASSRK